MGSTKKAQDTADLRFIEVHDCAACGVVFGLDSKYGERRRKDGKTFSCPNGHTLSWKSEAAEEKKRLETRLKNAEAANIHLKDQAQAASRSASAYKGQITRLKKRVGVGVCPCCQRTFQELGRHMRTQHPEFRDE